MKIQFLSVPYDSAQKTIRMGAGPQRLLEFGIPDRLRAEGHQVRTGSIEADSEVFPAEIQTAFALNKNLAKQVSGAKQDGFWPVVFAGNCNSALGILAGLREDAIEILWFDCHADFNTPESTTSGFLDGMAVAMLTGRCWKQLAASVAGFRPVDESSILLIGTRDIDPQEALNLKNSAVSVFPPPFVREKSTNLIDSLPAAVETLYVHIDLDVIDKSYARANSYATEGGLTVDELASLLRLAKERYPISAVAFTSFDPSFDTDNRICHAVGQLIQTIVNG